MSLLGSERERQKQNVSVAQHVWQLSLSYPRVNNDVRMIPTPFPLLFLLHNRVQMELCVNPTSCKSSARDQGRQQLQIVFDRGSDRTRINNCDFTACSPDGPVFAALRCRGLQFRVNSEIAPNCFLHSRANAINVRCAIHNSPSCPPSKEVHFRSVIVVNDDDVRDAGHPTRQCRCKTELTMEHGQNRRDLPLPYDPPDPKRDQRNS